MPGGRCRIIKWVILSNLVVAAAIVSIATIVQRTQEQVKFPGLSSKAYAQSAPDKHEDDIEKKNVLLINSYHPGYSWSDDIDRGIESALRGKDIELFIEYLDSKRRAGEDYFGEMEKILRYKYAEKRIDAIIAFDQTAFNFMLQMRKTFHSDIPLVFGGINQADPKRIADYVPIFGLEERDVGTTKTVQLITSIHPHIQSIVFVADRTPTGKSLLNDVKKIEPLFKAVKFDYLLNLSKEELKRALARLTQNSAVVLLHYIRDKNGEVFSIRESQILVIEYSPVPVYVFWSFEPNTGVLGGSILSGFLQGSKAGEIVLNLLNSENVDQIPRSQQVPFENMFDYKVMQRFGVGTNDIPSGSTVLNMPGSYLQEHRWESIGIVAFLFTQTAIILGLLINRARRIETEKSLLQTQDRMRLATEAADIGVWDWNPAGEELWSNEVSRERFGIRESQRFSLSRFLESIHPDDRELIQQKIQHLQESGGDFETEYRLINTDGETRWIIVRGQAESAPNAKPFLLRGVSMDITERKKTEQALGESEQLARSLLNATTDMTHFLDEDGTILDLNDAMAAVLGGTREELIGTCVFDRFSPEAAEYRRNLIRQAVVERKHMRQTDRQTPGKVYEVGVYPIETSAGGKNLVVIFAHDITEREKALKALKKSEARLKEAQRIARIGNWELDLLTDTLTWSEEVFRIFEIDPDNFGESYEAFLNAIHPDDRDTVNDAYKRSLKTRLPYGLDHRLLMPDGRIKYVREQCETFYSPEGKPLRSVGTVQDITATKQADKERMQLRLELVHLNRVMQMNELSSSFAHEINQPLGAILNNATAAQILSSRNKERDDEVDEILGDIIQDANRIGQIVQRIRAAIKKEEPTFKPLNMNGLIKDVVESSRRMFRKNHVSVVLDLQPNLAQIRGDHIGLQQVLINLITNAVEAMRESSSKNLEIGTTMPSPDKLIVSVGDSGMGIDKTTEDKLFVPFFTTKKDGLGMGLRICRAIIEEHGGRIWVENNSNGGATFSFSLKAKPGESK